MGTIYGIALREGEPVEGVAITLLNESGESVQTTATDSAGTFTLDAEAGMWTVRWMVEGKDSDEGQVEVVEGEDAEIELEV